LLLVSSCVFAQDLGRFRYVKFVNLKDSIIYKKIIDKSEIDIFIRTKVNAYKFSGYWLASCDSVDAMGDTLIAYMYIGKRFNRLEIGFGVGVCDLYPKLCKDVGKTVSKEVSSESIALINKEIEKFFKNNGYPFFSYTYDSIFISEDRVKATLNIDPFLLIQFDSLVLESPLKSQNKYLQSLLKVKKGEIYSQNHVDDIANLVENTGFLTLVSEPYVVYKFDKAYVHVDLKERKTVLLNGLVGYLPDQNTRKNILVGEAAANFKNLFGQGIFYGLKWKRFQQRSQDLNMRLSVPFILGSPISSDLELNLLKQDTSFVNINRRLKFSYALSKDLKSSLSYQYYTSVVNSPSKEYSTALRGNNTSQYGLGLDYNTLGTSFFPIGGGAMTLEGTIGTKILNQGAIDSLPRVSTQFNGLVAVNKILRVSRTSVLALRVEGRLLWNNKGVLLLNDLYRLGGINDLRGFNEKYFFSDKYTVNSLEYRKLISKESYLVTFIDIGLVSVPPIGNAFQIPIGMGGGCVFRSPIGVFKVFYSLGKSKDQRLTIQSSKIHFTLSNEF
jgi:translocation and assembly module TamA